jgi:large subunit ribosomal protein L1
MVKLTKRFKKAHEAGDLAQPRALREAVELLAKFPPAKFDETVELQARLGLDPKQSDQAVRGTVALPNGSGRKVRVLVFTENPAEALAAGADFAGLEDLMKKITDGWMDFDVAIATTNAMKTVRSIARVLGPKGLMPNPKSGTVVDDVKAGIKAVKAGRVEFKMDKTANVAIIVGKRSFTPDALAENATMALEALGKAKPESCKGKYIKSLTLSSTMSPGVRIDAKEYGHF